MNLHTALDIAVLAASILSQLWWLYQWARAQRTIRDLREQLMAKGGNRHLNNVIGNAVGEAKKRMFQRLDTGQDLKLAIGQFKIELASALDRIEQEAAQNLNQSSVAV